MQNTKRLLAILFSIGALLLILGCSTGSSGDGDTPTTTSKIVSVAAYTGTNILVTFDEAIAFTGTSDAITVHTGQAGAVTTNNVVKHTAINGKVLSLTVTDDLVKDEKVKVTIGPNVIEDSTGNVIAVEITSTVDATVAIDDLNPTVFTVVAAAGFDTITVQFSEEITNAADSTGVTVKIGDTPAPSTGSTIQSAARSADNHSQLIITLTDADSLTIGKFIKVEFAANNKVADPAGNQLVAIMPATVAVADLTAPQISSGKATEGNKFVSVVFSEAIAATTDKTGITVSTGVANTGGTRTPNVVVSVALDSTDTKNKTLTITVTDGLTLDDYALVTFAAGHTITDRAASPNTLADARVSIKVVAAVATALTTNAGFELWIPTGQTSPATITEDATITYNNGTTKSAVGFAGIYVSIMVPNSLLVKNPNNIALTANTKVGTAVLIFAIVGTTNPVIASATLATARVITADTEPNKYYFFGNTLDHNGIFYRGYDNTQTYVISGDTTQSTQVMKITDTNTKEWAAGGYQMPNYVDIDSYTHLVVIARKTDDVAKTAELSILLKFSSKADGTAKDSGPSTKISEYDSSGAKTDTPLTADFKTYKIPVATLAGSFAKAELRNFNLEFPSDTTKTAYEVEIQAIYFE